MRYLGSIKKLTSILLTKSGFNVTLSASTASASTEFQLPAAGGGTKAIVTEDASQTLSNKDINANDNTISNIADANIVAAAGIDVTKLASGDVDNTEFSYLDGVTSSIQTQLGNKQDTSEKGAADGYASLDSGGKVPAAQLPSSLLTLEGTWNATTNTPTLVDGTGDPGMVYLVTVAGSQDLGSGSQTFAVGDWVLYNASDVWQQSNNSTSVASVNGYTGVVTLSKSDVALGNVDNTSDASKNSAAVSLTNKLSIVVDNLVLDGNSVSSITGPLSLESEVTAPVNITAGTDVIISAGSGDSIFLMSDTILRPGKALRIQEPAGGPRAIDIVIPNTIAASRTLTLPDADGTVALVPGSGVVRSSGSALSAGAVSLTSEVSGVLPVANGGAGTPGANGTVFTVVAGVPTWAASAAGVPIGSVIATFPHLTGAYDCTALPATGADANGFVQCNGTALSDGTSPMNGVTIPNINNDIFIRGNVTSGSSGGASSVTLSVGNLPSHNHDMGHGHSHTIGTNSTGSGHGHGHSLSADAVGNHSHGGSTGGTSTQASPAGVFAAPGATYGQTSSASHSHSISPDGGHGHPISGTVGGSDGGHTHGITGGVTSMTGNTGLTGSATSFNIIPPYITARYIMRVK